MKKLLYILVILICFIAGSSYVSYSKELETETGNTQQSKVDKYIRYVYEKIKFKKGSKLAFEPFKYGFYGYLNMIEAGKISPSSLLTICDYTLSSNMKRMWVIDIKNKKVVFNNLVSHGMATGQEFAINFSNIEESHQSSLGFYTTGETYEGNNGYSLKLHGVDGAFNNNAYDRAIVIHGAEYVCDEYAKCHKRIGRSHGCPALPVELAPKIIDKIKNGTCLFIYHSSKNYLSTSYWLRNKIKQLPQEADHIDLLMNAYNEARYKETDDCETEQKSETKLNTSQKVNDAGIPSEKIITSIIIVNERGNGISDTVIVK